MPAPLGLAGALDPQSLAWTGAVVDGEIQAPDGTWRLQGRPALEWRPGAVEVRLASHCWERRQGQFCLTDPLTAGPGGAAVDAALEGFPLRDLRPWMPEGVDWDATLSAETAVRWQGAGLPEVTLSARSTPGRITAAPADADESLTVEYQALNLAAELDEAQATLSLGLKAEELGEVSASARLDPSVADPPLDGEISVEGLRLGLIRPFLPQLRDLQGVVSVDGRLAGSLRAPRFNGQVNLRQGLVALPDLPVPLEDIELTAEVAGASARIGGSFRSGEGVARIGGSVSWEDTPTASVALQGQDLEMAYPPLVRLRLSPAMTLSYDGEAVSVNGRLTVPWARITVEELPAGATTVSRDVVIVNEPAPEEGAGGEEGGLQLSTNVYLVLGDDVRFQGFGAQAGLTGRLQLRQIGTDSAEAFGEVNLVDGSFRRFGQELTLRRGRFLFSGPLSEPRIHMEAIRKAEQVVAGLRVTGTPGHSRPACSPNLPCPRRTHCRT
ncbi:MAG: translocation/assembly module TamB domain-containing protein [Arhodomonas sp.]|nr:translocation/assembly module TamB domain-containing protein [Arhodomonas sp.]